MKTQKVTVRTTPEEVQQYKVIKAMHKALQAKVDEAGQRLRAVYKSEGRPTCGGLEIITPKSAAVRQVDAELSEAMEVARQFRIKVGAKRYAKMHRLELAGLI